MATSVSAILIPCLRSFNQLQERVERPDYSFEGEVSSVSWSDELGRLRVWAANIGAHQTGQSSLEFRLRDASHISNQITNLLKDLEQILDDTIDELSVDHKRGSEEEESSTAWSDESSTTELQQLYEEVVNIIDCLYQLSMLIRKPAQHDLLVGSRVGDKAEFEFYDKEHVRNLHPKTEEQINQRLGRAITRRRKYLSYRERHHRKLGKGIDEVQGIQQTTTGSVMSETIATDFRSHNIDFEETSSNSGMSQTSYAPSLIGGGRVTIPPPPKDSVGGKPFECPYCFFVIEIKSPRSWTRHIFKDIKPYVCTFTDCSMPDRLYDSRREWHLHETTEHHRDNLVCALCEDTLQSSKLYERHVARHLEELALFALPRIETDDLDEVQDEAGSAVSLRSEPSSGEDDEGGEDHEDDDQPSHSTANPSVSDNESLVGGGERKYTANGPDSRSPTPKPRSLLPDETYYDDTDGLDLHGNEPVSSIIRSGEQLVLDSTMHRDRGEPAIERRSGEYSQDENALPFPPNGGTDSPHRSSSQSGDPLLVKRVPLPAPTGILRKPSEAFPDYSQPYREGIAPFKDVPKRGVPQDARWTKIDRKLVNPQSLEEEGIKFMEYEDHVIVLKVMDVEEIEKYVRRTAAIRGRRREWSESPKDDQPSSQKSIMREDKAEQEDHPTQLEVTDLKTERKKQGQEFRQGARGEFRLAEGDFENTEEMPGVGDDINKGNGRYEQAKKPNKAPTETSWTPAEEQRLKAMRDAGNSWDEIVKVTR